MIPPNDDPPNTFEFTLSYAKTHVRAIPDYDDSACVAG
jgi:hypothetical protein